MVKELAHQITTVSEVGQRQYESIQAKATRRHHELLKALVNQPTPPKPTTHKIQVVSQGVV